MSEPMYDVRPDQYLTVLREMLRHENDISNHRMMWLLVGQGFIANAFVYASAKNASFKAAISVVGILLALSAFIMLYKSYQARGYIQFLAEKARQGTLLEHDLPIKGWPSKRIAGWWKHVWLCRWLGQLGDLLEPWLLMPFLFMFLWVVALLRTRTGLEPEAIALLSALLTLATLSVYCVASGWLDDKEERIHQWARVSRTDNTRH